MKIDKEFHDEFAILTLKGEFDTFYVPSLQEEVDDLLERGIAHIVLNMRLVKFVNSTALGAIIKVHKLCRAEDGDLVISHPSSFVRDVVGQVGLDQLVSIFDDDDAAVKHMVKLLNEKEFAGKAPLNQEKVMVAFPDDTRNQQIGGRRTLIGTMLNVDGHRVQFLQSGKSLDLTADQVKQLFFKDSECHLKFQVKMFKKGYFEVTALVVEAADADDGQVKITAEFQAIADSDRDALNQFAEDMSFLKKQLPGKD